jgi:hypothetical protein
MKANETPEKLYLSDIQRYFDDTDKTISTIKYADDDIEYTRTDAFIKKACEWLKKNVTYTHPRKGTEECVINLNAFREAMKGE